VPATAADVRATALALPEAAERPDVFSVPHHYRNSTFVVVDLAAVDRAELTELLTEAWRLRAPARLRAAFDEAESSDQA
jgi:hypothetical protein